MVIVWDEPKRLANLDKHGIDFAAIGIDFFARASIRQAKAGRLLAIGRLRNGTIAVVFVRLGSEGLSIISARPANPAERSLVS